MVITGLDLFDQIVGMVCAKVRLRCSWLSLVLIYLIKLWVWYVPKFQTGFKAVAYLYWANFRGRNSENVYKKWHSSPKISPLKLCYSFETPQTCRYRSLVYVYCPKDSGLQSPKTDVLYKEFKNAVKSKSLEISLNVVVVNHVTTI